MPTDTPTKGLRVRNSGSGGNGLNSGLPCTFAAGSASARRVRRHVLGDVGGRIFSGKALVPNIGLRFTDNSISTPASRIRMTTLRNSGERPELRLLNRGDVCNRNKARIVPFLERRSGTQQLPCLERVPKRKVPPQLGEHAEISASCRMEVISRASITQLALGETQSLNAS